MDKKAVPHEQQLEPLQKEQKPEDSHKQREEPRPLFNDNHFRRPLSFSKPLISSALHIIMLAIDVFN